MRKKKKKNENVRVIYEKGTRWNALYIWFDIHRLVFFQFWHKDFSTKMHYIIGSINHYRPLQWSQWWSISRLQWRLGDGGGVTIQLGWWHIYQKPYYKQAHHMWNEMFGGGVWKTVGWKEPKCLRCSFHIDMINKFCQFN